MRVTTSNGGEFRLDAETHADNELIYALQHARRAPLVQAGWKKVRVDNHIERKGTALLSCGPHARAATPDALRAHAQALDSRTFEVWVREQLELIKHALKLPEAASPEPAVRPLVGSIRVGATHQQGVVFVQHLPRDFVDVVGKAFDHVTNVGRAIDDAGGYQSLYDAIVQAQLVGTRLMGDVKPENLLFVFGQSAEALAHFPFELALAPGVAQGCEEPLPGCHQQHRATEQKGQADNRAVVLCQLSHAEQLQELRWRKQQRTGDQADWCEVSWGELQHIGRALDQAGQHARSVEGTPRASALEGGAA